MQGVYAFERIAKASIDLDSFVAAQKGLVNYPCRVMTDATLIAADASLDSLISNKQQESR